MGRCNSWCVGNAVTVLSSTDDRSNAGGLRSSSALSFENTLDELSAMFDCQTSVGVNVGDDRRSQLASSELVSETAHSTSTKQNTAAADSVAGLPVSGASNFPSTRDITGEPPRMYRERTQLDLFSPATSLLREEPEKQPGDPDNIMQQCMRHQGDIRPLYSSDGTAEDSSTSGGASAEDTDRHVLDDVNDVDSQNDSTP